MRTEIITRNLYKFDELTEAAQEKAVERLSDLNVDYEWWESTYEDAENIGLKISSFDLGGGREITGDFCMDAETVAENIQREHGAHCDTYKTAQEYLVALEKLRNETPEDEDADTEEIDREFKRALLEDYLSMLDKEYEYLTSREQIIETIESMDYEFTEDGKLV